MSRWKRCRIYGWGVAVNLQGKAVPLQAMIRMNLKDIKESETKPLMRRCSIASVRGLEFSSPKSKSVRQFVGPVEKEGN